MEIYDTSKTRVEKYQVKEIVALASEQNNCMITALGRVSGRPDTIEVLRDSGCSTMVIREDLCDPRNFTGETRGCVMMDDRVVEVPVVKKRVDTPYYIGEVEGVAMKAPIYDLVIGNVHRARGQEDPDTRLPNMKCQLNLKMLDLRLQVMRRQEE